MIPCWSARLYWRLRHWRDQTGRVPSNRGCERAWSHCSLDEDMGSEYYPQHKGEIREYLLLVRFSFRATMNIYLGAVWCYQAGSPRVVVFVPQGGRQPYRKWRRIPGDPSRARSHFKRLWTLGPSWATECASTTLHTF